MDTERTEKPIMPRWLEIQAEMDFIDWRLRTMHREVGRRSPLDQMIDQATGHEAAMTDEARELIERAAELRAEWDQL